MRIGSRLGMGKRVETGIRFVGKGKDVVMCRYGHTEAERLKQRTLIPFHKSRCVVSGYLPEFKRLLPQQARSSSRVAAESRPRTPCPQPDRLPAKSLQVRSGETLHHARALLEAGPEDAVRVLEHAVLETYHDELTALEPRLDQAANVLRMREVQGRVDFVEDVHGCRLELEEGEDEGEGYQ